MIKSKFNTYQYLGQFVITGMLVLCAVLAYAIWFGKVPPPLFSRLGVFGVFISVIMPFYIIAQMKLNYKTTIIDTELQTITFKMFVLPIAKTYSFDYFDGYVDTMVKDRYDDYKCVYLVKDGRLLYKMSGRFYDNIDELKQSMSSLKHMGFVKYTTSVSFKIAFGKIMIS